MPPIKVKLSVRQHVIKLLLLYFEQEKLRLHGRIAQLHGECTELGHVIIPRNLNIKEELKTDKWASTGALCAICGTTFGWWCPKSPDHLCKYPTLEECRYPKGTVDSRMIGYCKYCHMPEERK